MSYYEYRNNVASIVKFQSKEGEPLKDVEKVGSIEEVAFVETGLYTFSFASLPSNEVYQVTVSCPIGIQWEVVNQGEPAFQVRFATLAGTPVNPERATVSMLRLTEAIE